MIPTNSELNKMGLIQLVPGLSYSVTNFCPASTMGTPLVAKGRCQARNKRAEGTLPKGLMGEAVHSLSQSCHTETMPPIDSISTYVLKGERNFALCLKCTDF